MQTAASPVKMTEVDMENPLVEEAVKEVREALENNDHAAAAARIKAYLDEQSKIPLNIAVTGETGSGKSTFINAFRGIDNWDERAAPTGCVETTSKVTAYPHPDYPNVKVWDLPGIGTIKFPAEQYLEHVGLETFDFFIIISDNRFRENDVKLAEEIQGMKKKFYFVRSKIDHNMQDEKRSQKHFKAEETLTLIREDCAQGLQTLGVESPKVFLVSSFELHLFDFPLLQETLERELPAHKRDVLLLAMPNISLEIINKKKEAFKANIIFYTILSALAAAVPVPGTSILVDLAILAANVTKYQSGFGLDSVSLHKLADSTGVSFDDLKEVTKSSLSAREITTDVIIKILKLSTGEAAGTGAGGGRGFTQWRGIPKALRFLFMSVNTTLNSFLDMLADDAQRVITKALGLNSPV